MSTLTDAQKDTLRAHLADQKYQTLLNEGKPGHVVDLLNDKSTQLNQERWVTSLTIMAELGVSMYRSIMNKLDAIAVADVAVRDFAARLRLPAGADIGHVNTLDMIDQLAALQDGFTPEEATALKAMSLLPASPMDVLGLPPATEEMLRDL
jgi:hypothetical protein